MTTVTRVMSVDLIPADAMAALRLRAAIDELCAEDPTLGVSVGPVNEIILQGTGELHLEIAVAHLKRKGLDFEVGAPEVAYGESITKSIEWDYTHKRQTGGSGEHAKVRLRLEPGEPGSGFRFARKTRDQIPPAFVPAVERAVLGESRKGPVAGFPLTDMSCTLLDGSYHDGDSSERTLDIAARTCFRQALLKAGPRLLEPMMKVEVVTPEEHIGEVVGDLNSRRGQVLAMELRDSMQEITAIVALSNMFGYVHTLWSMTQGRANYTMTFVRYEQVPPPRPDDDPFAPAVALR